ncbi:MAG: hypothetical protein HKP43_00880 [Altererythrobacter sp.]|nr:hypothetical protein [Altererythrobacter sp.]MBT8431409.1 hypothetical protein [Altererythrobacter sp.]NNE49178.1 hypothetical protein [Altererythrobacter sp.]NNF94439.1 hypothetical protein [Altererythrobacter sp.]NNK45163.1 hypothetical protein [Altererythrobacter sp.]
MTKRSIITLSLAMLALGACGQRADIEPLANASLPTAPFGSEVKPEAEQLLELETLAAPERSVELRRRSEEREDDPFDLPPE